MKWIQFFAQLEVDISDMKGKRKRDIYYDNIDEFMTLFRKIRNTSKRVSALTNVAFSGHPEMKRKLRVKTGPLHRNTKREEKEFRKSFRKFKKYVKTSGKTTRKTLKKINKFVKKEFPD